MNWEVILWTCVTLVVIMGVFGIIMSVISATNMKKRRENMRNLYIEKLTEFAGKETRSVWEGKILGIGSPKQDRESVLSREMV